MGLYEIELLRVGDGGRAAELRETLAAELADVGLPGDVVSVGEDPPDPKKPSVTVFLPGEGWGADATLTARIEGALAAGRPVVPVVEDLRRYEASVPPVLRPINGLEWPREGDARRLARFLLEELGIEDRQRRVFVSHKREDGLGAAEQLHDRLTHRGFVPFLDRFAIRPAEDVQRKIADALEDHAFLLLLETPLASTSPWVFDEVDYALSHSMGILILRWPGSPPEIPGSVGLPRIQLAPGDLDKDAHGFDVLRDAALDRVASEIEAAHARGLVRRRKMLVRSIEDAAAGAGCRATPLPAWRLHVECGGSSTLLGVTPRLPTAEDLQMLDQARSDRGDGASAVLVHAARRLEAELRAHLQWVVGGRELTLIPENAIGGRWSGV